MSSLVLTIHNFGVPNFDPYPYVNKNRLLMFDVVLLIVFLKPVFLFMALFLWHDDMVIQHKYVYIFGIWSHGGGFPSCNPVLSTCSTHLSKLEFAFKIICYRSCFDIWNKYTRQEQKRLPANVWRWSSASRIFEIYVELGWIGAWNGGFLKWWIPKNE